MVQRLVAVFTLIACVVPCSVASAQTRLRGLVVVVDFSDVPGAMPLSRADAIVNGVGYREPTVTQSLRDYYYAQSRGEVLLTHDVVGYFRAPHPASWYAAQPFQAFITPTRQALEWVVATNPDYDWDALSLANGPLNRHSMVKAGQFSRSTSCRRRSFAASWALTG